MFQPHSIPSHFLPFPLKLGSIERLSFTIGPLLFARGIAGYGSCLGFNIDNGKDLDFFNDFAVAIFASEFETFVDTLLVSRLTSRMFDFRIGSLRISMLSSLSQFILALRSAAACLSFSCLACDL
jgi:hypothetical protein